MHNLKKSNVVGRRLFIFISLFVVVLGIGILLVGRLMWVSYNASIIRVKFACTDIIPVDRKEIEEEWPKKFASKHWYQRFVKVVQVELTPPCQHSQTFKRTEDIQRESQQADKDVDIIAVDIAWADTTSEPLTPIDICPNTSSSSNTELCISEEDIHQHFSYLIRYAKINDVIDKRKVMGVPVWADIGLLFYNKNFINNEELPRTWPEIAEAVNSAKRKHPQILGFSWQGQAYEGLVCNLMEWIGSSDNLISGIYDKYGRAIKYTIHGDIIIKTAEMAKSWIWYSQVSHYSVLQSDEMKSIREFANGDIVFMRNWSRAWDQLPLITRSDPSNDFSVSLLPARLSNNDNNELRRSGVLGGWLLAVTNNAGSDNKKVPIVLDLIKDLTGKDYQLKRAREASFLPTIREAYDKLLQSKDENNFLRILDRSVRTQFPGGVTIADLFDNAHAIERPYIDLDSCYVDISKDLSTLVHGILALEIDSNHAQNKLDSIRTNLSECKKVPVSLSTTIHEL